MFNVSRLTEMDYIVILLTMPEAYLLGDYRTVYPGVSGIVSNIMFGL